MFSRLKKDKQNQDDAQKKNEYLINGQFKLILNSRGLAPVILQDFQTKEVLHLGFMDRWALDVSFNSNKVYLYRRSTGKIQLLGENQGHLHIIKSAKLDKNGRTLMLQVTSSGENSPQEALTTTSSFIHEVKLV